MLITEFITLKTPASINEMHIPEAKAVNESMKVTINNFETEAVKTTTNQNISGRENVNGTKSPIEIDDSSDQMEIENPHTDVIPVTDANTSWNTKSRLYNTSKTNNYTPEGRYSGTMLERSTDMTSGSCLTYVPSFDALTPFNSKEYSPVPQDTRSYFGRFYIPNMVETLCTRNFYSPVNRHFSQESIPERIVYERQLFNRLPTENHSSVMGMFWFNDEFFISYTKPFLSLAQNFTVSLKQQKYDLNASVVNTRDKLKFSFEVFLESSIMTFYGRPGAS